MKGWIHTGNRLRRKRGNGACDLTLADWVSRLKSFNGRCGYCREQTDRLELEHILPLAGGGAHTLDNVIPACARCNNLKAANLTFVFDGKRFEWEAIARESLVLFS
jgi:5-methylcytosine-specific restriction endonuclease McrA